DIDPIYESAAIGGFEGVSPLQMAAAYAAFGNGGTYNAPSAVQKVVFPDGKEWEPEVTSEKAMEDYTAYMVTDMLKSVMLSGTGTKANVDGIPMAGKTGSTNIPEEERIKLGIHDGLRDSWFSGYTTEYSLTVWTGYPSHTNDDSDVQYIKYDRNQDIAKQLYRELMTTLSSQETEDFIQPQSVVSVGSELYVKGAEPPPVEEPTTPPEEEEPEEEPEEEEEEEEPEEEEEEEPEEPEEDEEEENENENGGEEEDPGSDEGDQNSGEEDNNQDDGNDQDNGNGQNSGNDQGENKQNQGEIEGENDG